MLGFFGGNPLMGRDLDFNRRKASSQYGRQDTTRYSFQVSDRIGAGLETIAVKLTI